MIDFLNEYDDNVDVYYQDPDDLNSYGKVVVHDDNPVELVKQDPSAVIIAGEETYDGDEFYVDGDDVEEFAEANNISINAAIGDIILCNENSGMYKNNLTVVIDEHNGYLVPDLDDIGVNYIRFNNEQDNPINDIKSKYSSVVIAEQNGMYFVDIDDIQKCADIRNESTLDALDGVIEYNRKNGIDSSNLNIIMMNEIVSPIKAVKNIRNRNQIGKEAVKIINKILVDNNVAEMVASRRLNMLNNIKFSFNKGNELRIKILFKNYPVDPRKKVGNIVQKNSRTIINQLNSIDKNYKFTNLRLESKFLDTIDVVLTYQSNIIKEAYYEDDNLSLDEASLHMFPTLLMDRKSKKLQEDIEEAEDLLKDKGIDPKIGINKGFRLMFNILYKNEDIGSFLIMGLAIPIAFKIPYYLLSRIVSWAFRCGEEQMVISNARKVIKTYDELIRKSTNAKQKKELIDIRNKMIKKIDELEHAEFEVSAF